MLTRSWPIVDKISKIVGALLTKYQLLLAPYLAIFDKFDNMFDKVVTFDCQMFPKKSGNNLAKILPSPFFLAKVSLPLHLIRSPEEARSPTRCLSQPRREDVKGRCGPPIAALCRGIPGPSFTVTAPWCLHKKTRSALVATLHSFLPPAGKAARVSRPSGCTPASCFPRVQSKIASELRIWAQNSSNLERETHSPKAETMEVWQTAHYRRRAVWLAASEKQEKVRKAVRFFLPVLQGGRLNKDNARSFGKIFPFFFRGDSVEKLLIRISQQKRKRQKYPRNPNVLHRSFSDLSFNFFGKRGRRNSAKSASTTRACSTN